MFAGNFAPRDWFFCSGQLLSISQWTPLFALVGTIYGGNGQTTFALPDFRGRIATGTGSGPGLPTIQLGEMSGFPTATLISTNLPSHNHAISGTVSMVANGGTDGMTDDPSGRRLAGANIFTNFTNAPASMIPAQTNLTTSITGANAPFSIMPPFIGINYIICATGIFPSRN